MSNDLKWLILDSEWSYAIYYGFPSMKPQFMPAKNIKHRQFCTNASWSWDHEVSVYNVSVMSDKRQFKKDFRNDKVCAVALHKVMSEADVIVAHNTEFDIKMLNVIFAFYGLGMIPEKKIICTLKAARKYFRFAGNGLDDLLKFFGHEGKAEKPDWIRLTEGCPKEIKKSISYCDVDVLRGKQLLHILKPYMKNLPKPRVIKPEPKQPNHYGILCCDACGSKHLHNKGLSVENVKTVPRVKCCECGHYMAGSMKLWKAAHQ